jgi:aryl sulfotransferase
MGSRTVIPLYQIPGEDNTRWNGFPFRPDDIVIVTKPKCGTTLVQMLIAMMIFRTSDFPAPLWNMSRWIDWTGESIENLTADLEAQKHRRFLKTHTPLWSLPHAVGVKYVMVTRDPLDAALSMYYHLENQRIRYNLPPSAATYVYRFVHDRTEYNSLDDTIFNTGFALTNPDPDLLLIRYEDLRRDLILESNKIASHLGLEPLSEDLLAKASLVEMRKRSDQLTPLPETFKDTSKFFRNGSIGSGRKLLAKNDYRIYRSRMRKYPIVAEWYAV